MEVLEISDMQINTYKYTGRWKYSYTESGYLITVISDAVAYYEINSGIITRLAIEMFAVNDLDTFTKDESVVEAVGSFKMTLVLSDSYNNIIEVFFPFIAILTIIKTKRVIIGKK